MTALRLACGSRSSSSSLWALSPQSRSSFCTDEPKRILGPISEAAMSSFTGNAHGTGDPAGLRDPAGPWRHRYEGADIEPASLAAWRLLTCTTPCCVLPARPICWTVLVCPQCGWTRMYLKRKRVRTSSKGKTCKALPAVCSSCRSPEAG